MTRAQPGPGVDVPGTVEVSVDLAVNGTDDGLLLRTCASSPAVVAADARPGRVHEHHSPPSLFRFGCEDVRELRPARVEDRPIKPGLRSSLVGQGHTRILRVRLGLGAFGHPGRV